MLHVDFFLFAFGGVLASKLLGQQCNLDSSIDLCYACKDRTGVVIVLYIPPSIVLPI